MKIAILHPSLDVEGGAEKQVLMLAKNLKNNGHDVKIYVSKLDKAKCYPDLIKNLKIVECGGYGYGDVKKTVLFSQLYMRSMAKKIEDCDVINCHNFPTTYAAVIAKKKLKKPIVWMCNEPPFVPLYNGEKFSKSLFSFIYKLVISPFLIYNKFIAKKIDKIIVLDEMNKKRVNITYSKTSTVVHTGLDFPKISKVKKNKDNFIVLSAGRIDKGKRTEDAIKAVSCLKEKIPGIKLEIAGTGKLLNKMRKLVKQLKLEKYIIFHGRVSDKKLNELYSTCEVFLFTAENQSWGLVPLEAMAHKKPVIVSTGCGVADLLKEGNVCLKIKPRDVNDIVNKILLVYSNRTFADKLARNGGLFVRKEFSWDKYTKEMEKIFLSVIKR